MKSNREKLPNGTIAIPWKSLPKWVYNQRLSDKLTDRPSWYTDTDGLNNFMFEFRALPGDPLVQDEGEFVTIVANSRTVFLKALSAYRRDFNRDYDEEDFFKEKRDKKQGETK